MAEKNYSLIVATGGGVSQLVGLSGIVKRVRYYITQMAGFAADDQYWWFSIGPNLTRDFTSKFVVGSYHAMDAAPTGHAIYELAQSFDTNFYVDKSDYLYLYNASGGNQTLLVWLDIVPVSDKTRLYLGGEYHNQ